MRYSAFNLVLTLIAILLQLWTKSLKLKEGPLPAWFVPIANLNSRIPWKLSVKTAKVHANGIPSVVTTAPSEANVENPEEPVEKSNGDVVSPSYIDEWVTLAGVLRLLFAFAYFLIYFILVLALLT